MRTVKIQKQLFWGFALIVLVCAMQGCCPLLNIKCPPKPINYSIQLYKILSLSQQISILEAGTNVANNTGLKTRNTENDSLYVRLNTALGICNKATTCISLARLIDVDLEDLDIPPVCDCPEMPILLQRLTPEGIGSKYRGDIIHSQTNETIPLGSIPQRFLTGGFTSNVYDVSNQINYPLVLAPQLNTGL